MSDEFVLEINVRILSQERPVDENIELTSFLHTASYLLISESYVHSLLIPSEIPFAPFYDMKNNIIPALYMCKFQLHWDMLYDSLFTNLCLLYFEVDLRWSYSFFKRTILKAIRSRRPSHEHTFTGYCNTCHSHCCCFDVSHPFDVESLPNSPWFG